MLRTGVARHRHRRPRPVFGAALWLVVAGLLAVPMSGCTDDDDQSASQPDEPLAAGTLAPDPGPVHVHGLGVNPKDDALLIASHTGLYRAQGTRKPRRVGNYQDTMAFEVVGPDRFLGSGHPDVRADLPAYLGLIESRDGGRTWRPRSLQGKVDFHLLEADGQRVYGYGSDFETRAQRLLASADGGRTWTARRVPEPLVSLALDPADSRHLVASGQEALHVSRDGGKSWRTLAGGPGLLAWSAPGRLFSVDEKGVVAVSAMGGRTWQATGTVSGAPAAFDGGPGGRLLVALHDGTIKQSANGGVTWRVRSRPG
ncbi:MAG: glycoside hydrolase [Actinomycetota bacterium]|nr:glycoside hydrolase [Actinomycetota bacterium]